MAAVRGELDIGEHLGDFEILGEAGRGGMGVVYRARQISLERTIALKVISPEISDQPDFRSRFMRESRLAASIDHPNVVAVHGAGEIDGLSYIAMQWIEGTNVADALAEGPLDLDRVVAIGEQMGAALDAAHATGLIHRDIKPGNILLRKLGRRDHAYLTDFGIAKRSEVDQGTALTRAGGAVGTINYMAPEQLEGHAAPSSDLYALGCVLFEAATGRRPFERESDVAVMWAQMNAPRPKPSALRPGLKPSFDELIERALAIDPADRFADGAALGAALRRAGAGVPLPPPPGGRPPSPPPPSTPPPPPPPAPTVEQPVRRYAPPRQPTAETAAVSIGDDDSGRSPKVLIGALAGIAFVVAAVVAAFLLLGGGSDDPSTSANADNGTSSTPVDGDTGTPTDDDNSGQGNVNAQTVPEARGEIVTLLEGYQDAYSSKDTAASGQLMTSDIERFGRGTDDCTQSGREEVLKAYGDQFDDFKQAPDYSFIGLEPSVIEVTGDGASSDLEYSINGTPGNIYSSSPARATTWLISKAIGHLHPPRHLGRGPLALALRRRHLDQPLAELDRLELRRQVLRREADLAEGAAEVGEVDAAAGDLAAEDGLAAGGADRRDDLRLRLDHLVGELVGERVAADRHQAVGDEVVEVGRNELDVEASRLVADHRQAPGDLTGADPERGGLVDVDDPLRPLVDEQLQDPRLVRAQAGR